MGTLSMPMNKACICMKSNKRQLYQAQLADYDQLCHDRTYGRILTPDSLRFICVACNYDAEAIGRHFLEALSKVYPDHTIAKREH